jgi:putative transposase
MVERGHPDLSVRRQCELLRVNRAGLYYEPVGESEENLLLMRLLDEQYTRTPFYGRRRMKEWLATVGHEVNRKRVARLMELLGIEAVYPKPRLRLPDGTSQDNNAKAHDATWADAGKHLPENVGDTPLEVIVVELKK